MTSVSESCPICPICRETPNDLFLTSCCKKLLCGECKSRISSCPFCRSIFSSIPAPKELLDTLHNLTPCPYQKRGCRSRMIPNDVEGHTASCEYRPATCPNVGCEYHQENFNNPEEFPSFRLMNSKDHHCQNQRLACPHCKQQYFSVDKFIHQNKCAKRPRQSMAQSAMNLYSQQSIVSTFHTRVENWEAVSHLDTWESNPFSFENLPNYKFVFFIFPRGFREGSGTHVSVYLRVVPGEYDSELTWPCVINNFKITLEKQNSQGKSLSGSFTVPHLHDMLKRKTVDSKSGYGYAKFIAIADPRFKCVFLDEQSSLRFSIEASVGRTLGN